MATSSLTSGRRWGTPQRRFGASSAGRHSHLRRELREQQLRQRAHGLHRKPEPLSVTAARRAAGLVEMSIHYTLGLLALAAVLAFMVIAIGPRTGAYRTVTMLTGSMRPTYPVGSVLVDRPQPTSSLRVGQVLTYAIPVDDHRVVSHRVVSITRDGSGAYVVQTKGDANNGNDPWLARITDPTVWTARAVVPHAGSVILALRDQHRLRYAMYVIPGLLALWTLAGVWRRP